MLWKLELACANAQAQVSRRCALHGCLRSAASIMRMAQCGCLMSPKQALAEIQATATERSLPPPSYADKARAGIAAPPSASCALT
jgi:hypothetical protein